MTRCWKTLGPRCDKFSLILINYYKRVGKKLFIYFLILLQFSSCKWLYPNYIFRENKEYYYLEIEQTGNQTQLIMPGDRISFLIRSRGGYDLIDVSNLSPNGGGGINLGGNALGLEYLVREDGFVELPILGLLKIEGLDRFQLEDVLEEKYAPIYNDPFVIAQVTNHRVFVFMGLGDAAAVPLSRPNTTLLDVIAQVGGISSGAKSHKIKIIRGDYKNPSIKRVDLSTMAGLEDAAFVVQPNDLILFEPRTPFAPAILRDITPFLTLLTTAISLYTLAVAIQNQNN